MMGDDAWNQLSERQQNAIMEAGLEVEQASKAYYEKAIAEENELLKSEGMEELMLPNDVAEEYLSLAYEKGWESALKVDRENAEKLQTFTGYDK